jgi:hypothetical protein
LQFPEGSVLKYLYRWHVRGELVDAEKALHWLEMIIEHAREVAPNVPEHNHPDMSVCNDTCPAWRGLPHPGV